MIRPEPGRHVHFIPALHSGATGFADGEPHAAIIVRVWNDRLVNLTVFDRQGYTVARTSVTLQQPGDETPTGDYCRWMPYTVESERKRAATEQSSA